MLRNALWGVVSLWWLVSVPAVFAAERTDRLQAIGGFQTADAVVSGSSEEVQAVAVACGSSACTVSLYNGDGTEDMTNANGRLEVGAPANETRLFDLQDFPIRFETGVVLNLDANASAVTVYRLSAQ